MAMQVDVMIISGISGMAPKPDTEVGKRCLYTTKLTKKNKTYSYQKTLDNLCKKKKKSGKLENGIKTEKDN